MARPSHATLCALGAAPYKALRCAPTTRFARGSRVCVTSVFPMMDAWREALTAPRPERVALGN